MGANADGPHLVLFAYALGKAQRVLAGLDPSIGPVFPHGAVQPVTGLSRAGVSCWRRCASAARTAAALARALVLAPPSAAGTRGCGASATSSRLRLRLDALRGARRRRGLDRGFVLSDHADWPALLSHRRDRGRARVSSPTATRRDDVPLPDASKGVDAAALATDYGAEEDDGLAPAAEAEPQ